MQIDKINQFKRAFGMRRKEKSCIISRIFLTFMNLFLHEIYYSECVDA